jgi:periplasmic divalent cation tolerance protein
MIDQPIIVLITVPSQQVGEKIAEVLLEQKLAACVNIIPGIHSIYFWKGTINRDEESLLIVKSRAILFEERLLKIVQAIHPYEVPEIIALPIIKGLPAYLDWIQEVTGFEE